MIAAICDRCDLWLFDVVLFLGLLGSIIPGGIAAYSFSSIGKNCTCHKQFLCLLASKHCGGKGGGQVEGTFTMTSKNVQQFSF